MRPSKGILFDLDGTLIDSMNYHFIAWKKAFYYYHRVTIKSGDFFPLEGMKLQKIISTISIKYNIKKPNINNILRLKEELYLKNNKLKFYPCVKNIIKKLNKNHIKLGIVTSGLKKRVMNTLPMNFLKNFDVIVTGNDTLLGKPSKKPYEYGLKKLNIKSNECLVVENAPLGIKSAINANIFCIAVSTTVNKKYLFEANIIVKSFENLNSLIFFSNLMR